MVCGDGSLGSEPQSLHYGWAIYNYSVVHEPMCALLMTANKLETVLYIMKSTKVQTLSTI